MDYEEERRLALDPRRDGPTDRRADFCPVHNIKCAQWDSTEKKVSNRVPIWVFVIFISMEYSP